MNLGQLIDPEWVQDRLPRRAWERREADPVLVTKALKAEAERTAALDAQRTKEATARQRVIDRQADREAEESRARAAEKAVLCVPVPVVLAPAVPRAVAKMAKPVVKRKVIVERKVSKSARILRVLQALSKPQTAAAICGLLPDIERNSLHAFLAGFVRRDYAVRSGKPGSYKFAVGARGKQYLATFNPPD